MEIFLDLIRYAGYFAITVLGIASLVVVIMSLGSKQRSKDTVDIAQVNKEMDHLQMSINQTLLAKKEYKVFSKGLVAKNKDREKRPRLFVLDFKGDVKATEVENLRKEITTVLSVAQPNDEVLIRLESPGGMVHTYGLAASQLERLVKANIRLTVSVDRVAASGGYMMACVANKIVSAPFAMIGSIGVVAQVPNFNKLLKKHDVDYHEITAGQYKRTLTLFGEVTHEKLNKFAEQIQDIHQLFKTHIQKHRPSIDLSLVATGEYWYGSQALELNLVDEIMTSDEVLLKSLRDFQVVTLKIKEKKSVSDRLSEAIETAVMKASELFLKRNVIRNLNLEESKVEEFSHRLTQEKFFDPRV